MISSKGAASKFHEDCLGIYVHDGGFSNKKPRYKHEKYNRYLHWTQDDHGKSWWLVRKRLRRKLKNNINVIQAVALHVAILYTLNRSRLRNKCTEKLQDQEEKDS